METRIDIKNWNNISTGILNSKDKSQKLIIMIHWLWWNINEHIFHNWYKFFNNNWFDTFRLDLYWIIKLTNNSIKQHSQDLENSIKYFKEKYSEIYLIWHSLGWPIILNSDIDLIKKIILREPVLNTGKTLKSELNHNDSFDYVSWGMDIIIWENMKKEFKSIWDINNRLNDKYKIIYAWSSDINTELTNKNIENYTIKWADHCFNNEWNEDQLFNKTLAFISKN
jgi:hypothetical protein